MTKAEKEAFVKRMAAARRRKANGRKTTTTRKRASNPRKRTTTSRKRASNPSRKRTSPARRRRRNETKILGTTAAQRRLAAFSGLGIIGASLVATPVSNWVEDNVMTPVGIRPGWGQAAAYFVGGVLTFLTGLSVTGNLAKKPQGKALGQAAAVMISAPMFIRSAENAGVFGRPAAPVAALPPLPTEGVPETVAGRRRNAGMPQFTGAGLPTLRGSFGRGMRGSIVPGRLAGQMLGRGMRGSIVAGPLPGRSMRGTIVAGSLPGQPGRPGIMRGVRGGYGWY